ncbi:ran GTPase activating protein 1, partial [Aureobasidium melanogenum]|uniref:Ran GTPase activating protein 1 n=1 Tax=Aureobasidium melanogenum (strain CBS 110374) TaxID=1043003 RepID=A0A074VX11_AURM1
MANIFSLEGRALKLDSAADMDKHIADLKANNDVEEVVFVGNTLGVEACEALAKVLETKKKLKVANFADIFTSRLVDEIPDALSHLLTSLLALPELHTVNLSDNAFGLMTVAPLQPFLSQHVPLQHLILNNNGLGPAAGTLVAEALTTLAEKKEQARKNGKTVPDLETVICGRNRLENGSMDAWVKAYSANNKIKTIRMVQNGIRQEGISALLQNGLSKCSALEVLDLQDNTFTAMGGRALADVIANWSVIKELGVGDCLLSARGAVMLAEALKAGKNKTLQTLRLQYNEIDVKGIEALCKVAQTSELPALQRVELNGNKFSEDDSNVEALKTLLDERREENAPDADEDDETWGIDELDDLEEDSDDEDEDEDDEDAEEERVIKQADQAESETVAQEKDNSVDELADLMGKTELK